MSWLNRLWNSARRRDLAGEIDEELQFHIEASTRANLAAGMTPAEARRDALRRFGNPPSIQEQTRDANRAVPSFRVVSREPLAPPPRHCPLYPRAEHHT